ncbi:MAG: DUF1538 domain-containing protein [Clostridia bacterium]|nr:DUF1538 domain-containing protein [Clostridia bacterium]
MNALNEKIKESAISVLPILVIVAILCFFVTPVSPALLLAFLVGALMIIVGMGIFTLGAETSMTVIGNRIGASLTKSKKLWLILIVSFALGIAVTVSEPDLQVLAETVPHIDNMVLILTVGVGVGFFLMVCMLRIFLGIKLRWLLLGFYGLVFLLAAFSDPDYLAIAFDSGGVTTGPMTVPFILALGVGVANMRSDRDAGADSFGLVALCSIGPILFVLILGFLYPNADAVTEITFVDWANTVELGGSYISAIPHYMLETAIALLPIVAIFLMFQIFSLRMSARPFFKICWGILFTYVGLVLFLTGVNVGFSSLGTMLGGMLYHKVKYLLIPIAMCLGWFIISAEPAVYVLEKQIETVSSGAIPGKAIKYSLSIAIAIAMGIAMLRVVTEISLMWFLIPGYAIALILTFFVPDIYTAIAFDSGGVASGPMTATFMLQLLIGVCSEAGGNILTDAFGIVATVAMMPLISIQIVGFIYGRKAKTAKVEEPLVDDEIIELWG